MSSIIELDDCKNWLEIPTAITNFDALITMIRDSVIVEAEEYMNLKLSLVTGVVQICDGGKTFLWVDYGNISNVTIWCDANRMWDTDEYLVSPTTYVIDVEKGIIRLVTGEIFSVGKQIIKVLFSGGYTSSTLPKDLKLALIKQISWGFRRRKDPGISFVQFPDGRIEKFAKGEWLQEVEDVLNRRGRIPF